MSKPILKNTLTLGKYLVSPLSRLTACGRYQASVSIRNGRGSTCHDRVIRFIPLFASPEQALHYALHEGCKLVPGAQAA